MFLACGRIRADAGTMPCKPPAPANRVWSRAALPPNRLCVLTAPTIGWMWATFAPIPVQLRYMWLHKAQIQQMETGKEYFHVGMVQETNGMPQIGKSTGQETMAPGTPQTSVPKQSIFKQLLEGIWPILKLLETPLTPVVTQVPTLQKFLFTIPHFQHPIDRRSKATWLINGV